MTLHIFLPTWQELLCFKHSIIPFGPFQKAVFLKQYHGRNERLSEVSTVTYCNSLGQDGKKDKQRLEIRGKYKQQLCKRTSKQKTCLIGLDQLPIYLSSTFAIRNMILEDTMSQALSLAYTHHTLLVSITALIEILEDTSLRREDEKNNSSVVS